MATCFGIKASLTTILIILCYPDEKHIDILKIVIYVNNLINCIFFNHCKLIFFGNL